jgi:hypothetical protein
MTKVATNLICTFLNPEKGETKMALWGNKDTKAVTGTVAVANSNTTVTGTSTTFTTELKVGNTLVIESVPYGIVAIANTTSLTLASVYAGSTASGLTVTANESPASVPHVDKAKVFGVDTTEAAETRQITSAGWVLQTTGSGGRAGRVSYETLVAMGTISGDAEDTAFPDATITIVTQPVNRSVTAPAGTTFVVTATATQSATIVYDWEVSTNAGSTWANATGGVYSGADSATLTISNSTGLTGYLYRCNLTATGATAKTTTSASLTVA